MIQNYGKNGKGKIVSLLSLDIVGAFDNVLYERLLYDLRVKGVPDLIIN